MREILFRGKRNDNREFVEGWLAQSRLNTYPDGYEIIEPDGINYDELDYCEPSFVSYGVIPETIGQYTGMKDWNGVKVFEGDIVRLSEDVKQTFNVSDGEVRYGWGGFYIGKFSALNSLNTLASYDGVLRGEVVGNVHDNFELSGGTE